MVLARCINSLTKNPDVINLKLALKKVWNPVKIDAFRYRYNANEYNTDEEN